MVGDEALAAGARAEQVKPKTSVTFALDAFEIASFEARNNSRHHYKMNNAKKRNPDYEFF